MQSYSWGACSFVLGHVARQVQRSRPHQAGLCGNWLLLQERFDAFTEEMYSFGFPVQPLDHPMQVVERHIFDFGAFMGSEPEFGIW